MLYLNSLDSYIKGLKNCVSVSAGIDTETTMVLSTVETYEFDYESQVNERIGVLKDNPGFVSCKKKFIPAKEKKGEIVSDEYWKLTVTIKHDA